MSFLKDLKQRNLFHNVVSGTEEYLNTNEKSAYIGFDPTANSLHLGSFQQIALLKRMQLADIKPIALMGGATGRVGDPSGRNEERTLMTEDEINNNILGIQNQLSKFIDFGKGSKDAILVNNYDWFKDLNFLEFITKIGKHITVNYMMSKDSVQNRMESGISFTEFSYQLIQGYDFLHLFDKYNCKLQMGGSDQWGNIITGVDLIRKIKNDKAFAITSPLITREDGSKFGKSSTGENIWLDRNLTSPYKFYQFLLNRSDNEIIDLNRRFSFFDFEEILTIENEHKIAPHNRLLQKSLAKELTILVHSVEDFDIATKASSILFSNSPIETLKELDLNTINDVFEGIPRFNINKSILNEDINIINFLVEKTNILPSNGQARQKVSENAISINKIKVNLEFNISLSSLINDRYILVQQGKKNFFLVEAV